MDTHPTDTTPTHPTDAPTLNLDLLREIRETIRANPDRFVMANFVSDLIDDDDDYYEHTKDGRAFTNAIFDDTFYDNGDDGVPVVPSPLTPGCGTACCLAGWACVLGDSVLRRVTDDGRTYLLEEEGSFRYADRPGAPPSYFSEAARLLGLTLPQADALFLQHAHHEDAALALVDEVLTAGDASPLDARTGRNHWFYDDE